MTLARLAVLLLWPLAVHAQDVDIAPEAASGRVERVVVSASRHMVVAAHPLAAEAGRQILRQGGSAVDAAIATELVLGLVEPQSSGLGGGGFLLHFAAKDGAVTSYDGRETAPMAAKPDRFLDRDGQPIEFFQAVVGGRSVGVPGMARLFELAHQKHGRLPWMQLFEPALRLAEDGFPVSPRLNDLLVGDPHLRRNPAARALYYPHGQALAVGHILRNRAYADTLRLLAMQGADAFYRGRLAAEITRAAASDLAAADLAEYQAKERPALCQPYRVWLVCGMGPPSSGGVAVAQMLAILEPVNVAAMADGTPDFAHVFAEAGRLAYADRARYLADPDFMAVPVQDLLDRNYLRARAALIRPTSMGVATAGEVGLSRGQPQGSDVPGTTHLSVVDGEGNAVALTASIENSFGARILVGGMLLNNQLTDFSFRPEQQGRPVANRVQGGKRPLSAMAPTLVLDRDRRLVAVLGSPGGSFIINYVAKTLIGLLDWGLDPQAAVDLPNLGSRNGPTVLEAGTDAQALRRALEARGHEVRIADLTSGLHAIMVKDERLWGGADSRREGMAAGD